MNDYAKLTESEKIELSERIAMGGISRMCKKSHIDWVNVKLSSGAKVVGSYAWGSENGEFLRLRVIR